MPKVPASIAERIDKLNDYQPIFNSEVGGALRWVMRIQAINAAYLSSRISGTSSSTWRSYAQASQTNNRPLHAVACFSWLTQVSMLAILKGKNIQYFWPGVSGETIQCIVQTGLLPEEEFEYLTKIILSKLERNGYYLRDNVIHLLEKIPRFSDSFLMPNQLDFEDFKRDYYQSIANQLQDFREKNNIPIEILAAALNEPIYKVKAYEDPNNNVSIPVFSAVRLKLCFDITDTVTFISGMKKYHSFYLSRGVQQARERVIIEILRHLVIEERKSIINLVRAMLVEGSLPRTRILNLQASSQKVKPMIMRSDIIGNSEKLLASEENSDKSANALASSIAHELCNPLVKINSLAALAKDEFEKGTRARNNQKLEEYLRLIEQSSDGGIKLVRSMLKFAQQLRFDSNQYNLVSIADTVSDALQLYPFKQGERERVTADVLSDFSFLGSSHLIHYVLFNLLKNALYYDNSVVSIETELSERGNYLIFTDTGAGIPAADISMIFDDFMTSNKAGGFGLGLPFCKRAMLSMNGDISCHSELGVLTQFRLSFPLE